MIWYDYDITNHKSKTVHHSQTRYVLTVLTELCLRTQDYRAPYSKNHHLITGLYKCVCINITSVQYADKLKIGLSNCRCRKLMFTNNYFRQCSGVFQKCVTWNEKQVTSLKQLYAWNEAQVTALKRFHAHSFVWMNECAWKCFRDITCASFQACNMSRSWHSKKWSLYHWF